MNLDPKRLVGETYEEYKNRRKAGNKLAKEYVRGRRIKYTKKERRARIEAALK